MSSNYRIGRITGGTNAFGDHAIAIGHDEPEVLGRLRDELDRLAAELRGLEGAEEARVEAAALRTAVDTPAPDTREVRTRWHGLRKALAVLGVSGAVPLLAELSEIGGGVQEVLKLFGAG